MHKSFGRKGNNWTVPHEDVLTPGVIVRVLGEHRSNVFCSALPGWLCMSVAPPSRDCSTKQGQGSKLGLCPAPLVPAEVKSAVGLAW